MMIDTSAYQGSMGLPWHPVPQAWFGGQQPLQGGIGGPYGLPQPYPQSVLGAQVGVPGHHPQGGIGSYGLPQPYPQGAFGAPPYAQGVLGPQQYLQGAVGGHLQGGIGAPFGLPQPYLQGAFSPFGLPQPYLQGAFGPFGLPQPYLQGAFGPFGLPQPHLQGTFGPFGGLGGLQPQSPQGVFGSPYGQSSNVLGTVPGSGYLGWASSPGQFAPAVIPSTVILAPQGILGGPLGALGQPMGQALCGFLASPQIAAQLTTPILASPLALGQLPWAQAQGLAAFGQLPWSQAQGLGAFGQRGLGGGGSTVPMHAGLQSAYAG